MIAINLAEVISYYAKLGARRRDIEGMIRPLPIRFEPLDVDLSYAAGMLRLATLPQGLSLGDRYCLALARRFGAPALTSERQWSEAAEVVGVQIRLIR